MDPLPCLRDVELIHLSKDIPHTSYSELCIALGCPYNLNQSILAKHRGNYNEAMAEILNNWNTDQARTISQSRSNLKRKLRAVKLSGLGKKLFKGEYLRKNQDPHEQEATPLQSILAAAVPPLLLPRAPGIRIHHDEIDEALIRQLLKDMPDGITILLDGFNGKNCGANIMDVLSGRTLQEVTVMVTTQPRFANMLHRMAPGVYDRIDMH